MTLTLEEISVPAQKLETRETKTIWCMESTESGLIREAYDTEYTLYPLVWLNWDYIRDCYHGQSMITGLIPNQKFLNKMVAIVGISLLTTSFPKIIYDRTKVRNWDGRVGTAVGVQGTVEGVAKILDGASISPQIAQFLDFVFDKTHSLLGASDVAMGDSRPDNTSAIIALQRAANTPMEATKHNAEQCLMDLGRIWQDIMTVKYGIRYVSVSMDLDKPGEQPLGMDLEPQKFTEPFDFASLKNIQLTIEQEAGGSTYWSEIASMQTLDNLFMNKAITAEQYVARVPNGYIVGREELLAEMRAAKAAVLPAGGGTGGTNMSVQTTSNELPVKAGGGNGSLQRALNREGV